VLLSGSTEYQSVDIPSRQIATSHAEFKSCKFHALSAATGDVEDTAGGGIFSDGFDLTFMLCTFSGNAAVAGGAVAISNCEGRFTKCNFTSNKATFEAGVLQAQSSKLFLESCHFVQNEAELYVGAMKVVNSSIEGVAVIFHGNHALFHTSVLDMESSGAKFHGAQFSANIVEKEEGGVVHALKASQLKLVGCQFETIIGANATEKKPVRADHESRVVVKQSCFDTSEDLLRSGIDGEYVNTGSGSSFIEKCQCEYVSMPQPYDVVERNIKLESSLLTTNFVVTAAGLSIIALLMVVLVVFDEPSAKTKWTALI
jgi:hypothetical protein